ncbi:MAG: nuclear transport factor 2 family protein [Fimbriimonadaceae bacterium]|nr:nuclear transport factor 2 family protein [Fimbriimonadaceae bacterium]
MIHTIGFSLATLGAAALAIVLFLAVPTSGSEPANGKPGDVLAANDGFYSALNKMFAGDLADMVDVWSHSEDVTYMGPTGGFQNGWTAVLKDWEGQAAMKLGGRVVPSEVRVIVGQNLAVVNDYEEGENTNADGKVEKLRLRATNVYRLENGKWKMVGHHTDTLPYLAK